MDLVAGLALVSTLLIAAVVIQLDWIDRPMLLQPIFRKTAPNVPQPPQPVRPVEFGEVVSGIAFLELSSGAEEEGISDLQIEDLAISELEIPSLADSPEEPTEEEKT